jgi:hypothetical protein
MRGRCQLTASRQAGSCQGLPMDVVNELARRWAARRPCCFRKRLPLRCPGCKLLCGETVRLSWACKGLGCVQVVRPVLGNGLMELAHSQFKSSE